MPQDKPNFDDALLDWHLDRLDDESRAWIEAQLERDAELRARSDRLGDLLQPLDHWRVTPAPANLAEKVLDYVEQSARQGEALPMYSMETPSAGRRFPFPLRDVIAAAACILLLIGVLVPGVSELRGRSRRTLCASNLGSIFRGTSMYQQAFAGALPFAGNVPGASWLPGGAGDRPYASNSRHAYLLVKLGYVSSPDSFVCAAADSSSPLRNVDWSAYDDFPTAANISYASLNLAGSRPVVRPSTAMPYMSDMNPLFVNARFNEGVDPYKTNSPAHRGRGQNVLCLDGSTTWMARPVYGTNGDNLWLIGNIRRYQGIEAPEREDDVQLVPGFPATDPEVCRKLAQ